MIELQKINWGAELNTDLVNDAVQAALKTKKLFRYQFKEKVSDVTKLETEITQYVDCKYALVYFCCGTKCCNTSWW